MEKTLQVLNELVRTGVLSRYAIGGAMGATFYVEPVLTFDLDVFVVLPRASGGLLTLEPLYEALRTRGYREEDECVNIEGVPVQFLPAYNALLEEALAEAQETRYEATPTRVLRPEHLLAIALQTGREKDREWVRLLREQAQKYLNNVLVRHKQVEPMESVNDKVTALFAAKAIRRRKLAGLPFPDKVRAVLRLQRMVAPLWRARGRQVHVWKIDEPATHRPTH